MKVIGWNILGSLRYHTLEKTKHLYGDIILAYDDLEAITARNNVPFNPALPPIPAPMFVLIPAPVVIQAVAHAIPIPNIVLAPNLAHVVIQAPAHPVLANVVAAPIPAPVPGPVVVQAPAHPIPVPSLTPNQLPPPVNPPQGQGGLNPQRPITPKPARIKPPQ
ncbi:hypothetical protein M422DRAFT_261751 [Sphaerobolus stellatus SS14]|uniref:Uncharacterized protein n=1 Tax=Sphaerobolus stellatus (strain SS14) TaxID=990650 RepID=A0A0C9VEH7_SPHS4|nr:hypothetical protein M422DRAFT_261751 [Sphaerobolus stellatus SS14]